MLTRLLALSVALSALVAPVRAASPSSAALLQQFQDIGGRVYIDSDQCYDHPAFGWYVNGTIHICEGNHFGDEEELADTIRHEVWHVIQACNNGPLMYDLDREVGEAVRRGWYPSSYPRHQWETEAEARNAAFNYTEQEISGFMSAYCH